jgi:hypothetical protein
MESRSWTLPVVSVVLGITSFLLFVVFWIVIVSAPAETGGCGGGASGAGPDSSLYLFGLSLGAGFAGVITGILAWKRAQRRALAMLGMLAGLFPLTYVALLTLYVTFHVSRCATIDASAVGSLRTICNAEETYKNTYTSGYSETLAKLGGFPVGSNPTVGEDLYYRFTYVPIKDSSTGKVETYAAYADPLDGKGSHYFSDPKGTIHETTEPRQANSQDPIVERSKEPRPFYVTSDLEKLTHFEYSYAKSHGGSFSQDLTQLEGGLIGAGLIDELLASGKKGQYAFKYTAHRNPKTNKVESFEVWADPMVSGHTHFFADQTGIIRSTKEPRPSSPSDPPLPD